MSEIVGSVTEQVYQPAEKIKIVLFHERKDEKIPQQWNMFIRENLPVLDFESFKNIDNLADDVSNCDLVLYGPIQSEGLQIPKNGRIEIIALNE